ncbi:MAG: pyridoxamine 5'-phosphate oxidase family protein [Bacillota bacterium]
MRRSEKEIKDRDVITELLQTSPVGRLGTIGKDGYPVVKPLNFAYHEGKIYFHTAKEGEKIDDIRRDGRVCFEVDLPIAYIRAKEHPCQAEYLYRSVIIKGRARIIEDPAEKLFALQRLLEKYQPGGGYGDFPEANLARTGVVRIDIEEMTGKEDLGDGKIKETAQKTLMDKVPLPITLER